MKPTTLRLQENTLQELDREAEEYDFDNRTEYIRFILDNRGVVMENTDAYADENTQPLVQRVDELEDRVESLENTREQPQDSETRRATASRSADPHPSTGGERAAEPSPADAAGGGGLNEQIDALDLPGKADSAEGRRAIRALYEHVRREGRAQKSDFVDAVYPDHQMGYSSDSWWNAVGRETDGKEGFMTLARRRDDIRAPEGRGQRHFEFVGDDE